MVWRESERAPGKPTAIRPDRPAKVDDRDIEAPQSFTRGPLETAKDQRAAGKIYPHRLSRSLLMETQNQSNSSEMIMIAGKDYGTAGLSTLDG